jgi:hypothetical protein
MDKGGSDSNRRLKGTPMNLGIAERARCLATVAKQRKRHGEGCSPFDALRGMTRVTPMTEQLAALQHAANLPAMTRWLLLEVRLLVGTRIDPAAAVLLGDDRMIRWRRG